MMHRSFLLAATKSGAGKTTITLGILAALVRRGYKVQPFKVGPDFIDPTLHKYVTGNVSYNLDLRMMGEEACRKLYDEKKRNGDFAVVEGVMGLYDGNIASSAQTSKTIGLPVILIVDATSCAESAVASMIGFLLYDPEVAISGIIFNKIGSERHKEMIENAIPENFPVPILGFMPRKSAFKMPERHLGLFMGFEEPLAENALDELAKAVEINIDLDLLVETISSESQTHGNSNESSYQRSLPTKVRKRIAIAEDEAFCFYYRQNLEMLEDSGFEIVPFSPVHDKHIPAETRFLYFGGGYPELYSELLSKNYHMIASVREYFERGMPVYGECGGFMYLCEELQRTDDTFFSMTGIFPFRVCMNQRLRSLGYREATLMEDTFLGKKGNIIYGHEFHYSHIEKTDSVVNSEELRVLYKLDNNSYEGYIVGTALGSYVHAHFGQTEDTIKNLFNTI